MENIKPTLVEPGVKYFIGGTLNQCRKIKDKYYNMIYNLGGVLIFLLILGVIMFIKYKGRLTPREKEKKNREKKEYIFSKLQQMDEIRKKKSQELITNLPRWDDHPEAKILNRKIY